MIKRLSLLLLVLLSFSCDSNRVFEKDISFAEEIWHMDSVATFEVDIESTLPKDFIIKLRNDLNYPYQNCYINYTLQDASGSVLETDLVNLVLFNEINGEPLGKGKSIYQSSLAILENYRFANDGKYIVVLRQFMRTSELQGTYSVGLRVQDSSSN